MDLPLLSFLLLVATVVVGMSNKVSNETFFHVASVASIIGAPFDYGYFWSIEQKDFIFI